MKSFKIYNTPDLARRLSLVLILSLLLTVMAPVGRVSAATITVDISELTEGKVSTAYSKTVTASGGTSPYAYSITSGTVPGLSLSATGVLSGTPTQAGSYTITIHVEDSADPKNTADQSATVVIKEDTTLTISYPYGSSFVAGQPGWVAVHVSKTSTSNLSGTVTVSGTPGGSSCSFTPDSSGNGQCSLYFTSAGAKTVSASFAGDDYYNASSASDSGATVTILPAISTGRLHSCYLKADGTFSCWGSSAYYPAGVTSGATSLSAGGFHTCWVKSDGSLSCESDNTQIKTVPSGTYLAVSAGYDYACAIDSTNALKCWGASKDGSIHSPSGKFSAVSAGKDMACAISQGNSKPVCWSSDDGTSITAPDTAVKAISVGGYSNHACAITSAGALTCWGTPALTAPSGSNYVSISSGSDYSCAMTSSGNLSCWGSGAPVVDTSGVYTSLSSRTQHTCALQDKSGGGSYLACWGGENLSGQAPRLSLSPAAGTSYLPQGRSWSQTFTPGGGTAPYTLTTTAGSWPTGVTLDDLTASGTPTSLSTYSPTVRLSENFVASTLPLELKPVVQTYTLVVKDPRTSLSASASPVSVSAGEPVTVSTTLNTSTSGTPQPTGTITVTSSDPAASCSMTLNGSATNNCTVFFSAAGDYTLTVSYTGDSFYTASADAQTSSLHITEPVITPSLSAGDQFICSLNASGNVTCWGKNDSGQTTPPAKRFKQISAGASQVCGVGTSSRIHCWGWNGYNLVSSAPGTYGWVSVASGYDHACALSYSGYVTCWGNTLHGGAAPASNENFTSIISGANHSCGLQNGSPVCWGGDNSAGQLNVAALSPGLTYQQLSAGEAYTCGLDSSGGLHCWGDSSMTPPAGVYKSLSGGNAHACAISSDDHAVCWGSNTSGQASVADASATYRLVSAGYTHTCALRSDTLMECWGANNRGQAPVLSITPLSLPTLDVDSPWSRTIAASGGRSTNYIFTVASGSIPPGLTLDTNQGVLGGTPNRQGIFDFTVRAVESGYSPVVGKNISYHQVVRSKMDVQVTSITPAHPHTGEPVTFRVGVTEKNGSFMGAVPTGKVALNAGSTPICEITLVNGAGSCTVYFTTAGDRSLTATYTPDTAASALFLSGDNSGTPAAFTVADFTQAPAIFTGGNRTWVHRANGSLSCIGSGCSSELWAGEYPFVGLGNTLACSLGLNGMASCTSGGAPLTLADSGPFTGLSVGAAHACAIRLNGSVTCWGDNSSAQATPPAGTFVKVTAGAAYTCGQRTDGTQTCWGAAPAGGPGAEVLSSLSTGDDHACGLRADGSLFCWGGNEDGQSTPPGGSGYLAVASGASHSCALDGNGTVACWGKNDLGQTTAPNGVFTAIAAYGNHTCALRSGLKITCWGDNLQAEAPRIQLDPITEVSIPALKYWEHRFNLEGGTLPYAGAITSGALPDGLTANLSDLSLSPAGLIVYGTPQTPKVYSFEITWQDSSSIPLVHQKSYQLTITGADLGVSITRPVLSTALKGSLYSLTYVLANQGWLDVPQSTLKVSLPQGMSDFTYSGLGGCTLDQFELTCPLSNFLAQSTQTLVVSGKVTGDAGTLLETRAEIQPQGAEWPEIASRDNTDTFSVPVTYVATIYEDDFSSGTPGANWSAGTVTTTPGGVTYLGGFSGSDSTRLTFDRLDTHKRVTVSLDLYIVGPWDGNAGPSLWKFGETGQTPLFTASFCTTPDCKQSFPSQYPGGNYPGGTSAVGSGELGIPGVHDQRYHLVLELEHTASTLDLSLSSLGLPANAAWGVDNVKVKLDSGQRSVFLPAVQK